jgi:hypothetical protein
VLYTGAGHPPGRGRPSSEHPPYPQALAGRRSAGGGPITSPHLQLGKGLSGDPQGHVRPQPQPYQKAEVLGRAREGILEEVDDPGVPGLSVGPEVVKTAPRSPGRRYGALKKLDCSQCLEFQRRRVVEAIPREDEHVRFVQVEYKNPAEEVFRRTLCPVQKVLLLVKLFIRFRYRYIIFTVSEYCGYYLKNVVDDFFDSTFPTRADWNRRRGSGGGSS